VEQLQDPLIRADLHERRYGGVSEAGIGLTRDGEQVRARNSVASEPMEDIGGHLIERLTGKPADHFGRQARPSSWHIKAPVTREPREQGLLKAKFRGFASGADVAQGVHFWRWWECLGGTLRPNRRANKAHPAGITGEVKQPAGEQRQRRDKHRSKLLRGRTR
jgi:hypothetical protein